MHIDGSSFGVKLVCISQNLLKFIQYLSTMKQITLVCMMAWSTVIICQPSKFIHLDQFGYESNATKVAVLSNPQSGYNASENYAPGATIEVRNFFTDEIAYSTSPASWSAGATHGQSGDQGWWVDFTSLNVAGTYYINDPTNQEKSGAFVINNNPYRDVLKAALRMFYYNRCNHPKETPFAQTGWTDGMNFHHNLQDANCRYIYDPSNASLEKDLTGGWF